MGNVGNIEKVMVFGILLIIISILGIAIWGNNSVDDPLTVTGTEVSGGNRANALDVKLANEGLENQGEAADPRALIAPDDQIYLPGDDDFGDETEYPPEEVSYQPRPQHVDDRQGRAGAGAQASTPGTYAVKKGDTLGSIAKELFGSVRYLDELRKANEDVDPSRLQIGQVLNVPDLGGGSARPGSVSEPEEPAATGKATYKVKKGDTLFGISRAVFGTSARWRDILAVNAEILSDPNNLKPGTLLTLPRD
ncbi:MAG: LysM peptidoglycan-binding domain-containing protein [Planctomycetota bacterium]